jgi:hypothetical protein
MPFRVAQVDRGTLDNGRIRLSLLQDVFAVRDPRLGGANPGFPSFPNTSG